MFLSLLSIFVPYFVGAHRIWFAVSDKLNTQEQTTTSDITNNIKLLLQLPETRKQIVAHFCCIFHQFFFFNNFQYCLCCRASYCIPTERIEVLK